MNTNTHNETASVAPESDATEHDCPKCGEHFSTCICEEGKPELPQAYDIKHVDFHNLLTVVMGSISNQTGEPFDKAMLRSQSADEIWRRHKALTAHAEALAGALREILDESTGTVARIAAAALAQWEAGHVIEANTQNSF